MDLASGGVYMGVYTGMSYDGRRRILYRSGGPSSCMYVAFCIILDHVCVV